MLSGCHGLTGVTLATFPKYVQSLSIRAPAWVGFVRMAAMHRTVDEYTGDAMTKDDAHRATGRVPKMSERIANQIADKILGGGIEAGDRLSTEKEMVAEYGVARTTVREALRLLESRGLVTIRAGVGGGPVACRPQFESLGNTMKLFLQLEGANLSDVIDTRLTLEPVVAQQATPRTETAAVRSDVGGPHSTRCTWSYGRAGRAHRGTPSSH